MGTVVWFAWRNGTHTIFGREPERYRPLRRPRRIWEDTIRTNLKETEWDAMEWIHLPKDRYK
jgi:hypothetical protein